MEKELDKAAAELMKTVGSEKKDALRSLASSGDGEAVRGMLERGGFERAVRNGDTESVKKALSEVMGTDAGSRLIGKLQELMGGK